ncbi:hypothetical protein GLOTRDRAFT_92717 [Gloeophyllum trabeum ATCC 11539]|uniref:Uncharacterized protein n=1 Tax=Gloeophyllum trabeum (strain ATCC 11539 / FP-39264 / Madison 617) TaxID=670483 RepID=S7RSX0_GLOTA|nr:uncharacterized protein GLOTRDRAFT_92717 [Gloeophyllum trabeum ATCC 11539]EPQ56184.1 hypothetical protein GLOTRDRAFT_92717 [Gloeophyllum trabeum ATCC 11539]
MALFSGKAPPSLPPSNALGYDWDDRGDTVKYGGDIARTKEDRRKASWFFCSGPDDPWVPILTQQAIVVFHASWITNTVKENFAVALGKYVLDDRFEELNQEAALDHCHSVLPVTNKLPTPVSSDYDYRTTHATSDADTASPSMSCARGFALKRKVQYDNYGEVTPGPVKCFRLASSGDIVSGDLSNTRKYLSRSDKNSDVQSTPVQSDDSNSSRGSPDLNSTRPQTAMRPRPAVRIVDLSRSQVPVQERARAQPQGNELFKRLYGTQASSSRPVPFNAPKRNLEAPLKPKSSSVSERFWDTLRVTPSSPDFPIKMSMEDALAALRESKIRTDDVVVFAAGERFRGKEFACLDVGSSRRQTF